MDLGQDGSVKEIMPADEWNNITVEDINKGIVIVDNAITYTGTVPDFNEYVWVPIPDFNNFKRTAWTTTCGFDENGNWVEREVPHLLSKTAETNKFWEDKTKTEYINMMTSVSNNKGFYLGRYEASDNGSSIALSKRDQAQWTSVTQLAAINACTNNEIENAHLMYGIEFDSTLNWLIGNAIISSSTVGQTKTMELSDVQSSSSSWGNYYNSTGDATVGSSELQNTGYSEYWKANNIYDLAGNAGELIQENFSTENYATVRGDSCYNDNSYSIVSIRWTTKNNEYTSNLDRISC